MAVVRGGLSPAAFERLTPVEWAAICNAITDREEAEYRLRFEQTRMLVYSFVSPHLSGKSSPEDVMPFPWDDHSNGAQMARKRLSREEIDAIRQRLDG